MKNFDGMYIIKYLEGGEGKIQQIKTKNNKYMASDCPLAGKHLKQLEVDTNISNEQTWTDWKTYTSIGLK